MKRFLSILIALILVLSMFSVTAVAFAEPVTDGSGQEGEGESPSEARKLTFNHEEFKTRVFLPQLKKIVMSEEFMLDGKIKDGDKDVVWFKSAKFLHLFFDGINYIELMDEAKDESGDGWQNSTPFHLTYDYALGDLDIKGGEDEDESALPEEPEVAQYHETEHVKLDDAPEIEGYKFTGWTVYWENCDIVEFTKFNNFPAEFVFNMPAADVKVTANWQKLEVAEKDEDADAEEGEDGEVEYVDVKVTFYANDKIFVLYCGPDGDYNSDMDKWDYCSVDSTFNLDDEGEWYFRFAVVDGEKASDSGYSFNYDDVIATTYDNFLEHLDDPEYSDEQLLEIDYTLKLTADDRLHPVVKKSSTANDKEADGLTAGVKFLVSASSLLTVDDTSGWKATFEILKREGIDASGNPNWVSIYDSVTQEITEGYEECIEVSGSSVYIVPSKSDVAVYTVYKIVFSVKDDFGFYGVSEIEGAEGEYKPEIELKVVLPEQDPGLTAVEAWKIVLYVVAGLSAVGIVVLLFIKPKQQKVEDGRYSANAEDNGEANGNEEDSNTPQE